MINTMFEYNEEKRTYTVRIGNVLAGELYIESDGFYVFDPVAGRTGYWPAWMLRNIADKLDELNKEWEGIVTASLAALDPEALDPEALDTARVLK